MIGTKSRRIALHVYSIAVLIGNLFGCSKNDIGPLSTPTLSAPSLETTSIMILTPTTARVSAKIMSQGDSVVTERGICWGTQQTPTLTDNKTVASIGLSDSDFRATIAGLSLNTTYYARAYATSSVGTGYGNALSITTPSCQEHVAGSEVYEIDKMYQLLIGAWELYSKYEDHTVPFGQFEYNDLHWYYCANRERLVFSSDLSASSISTSGITAPLGTYSIDISYDGFWHVRTTSNGIDGNLYFSEDGRHLTIWNWRNVVAFKIYDKNGSVYVRSN